jgi:hypothetical protein
LNNALAGVILLRKEPRSMGSSLEDEKDAAIRVLTEEYASGDMDMAAFEGAVMKIGASPDHGALAVVAASLGIEPPPRDAPPAAVELVCVSGHIRKAGEWVKARAYRLSLKSSSARLDFRAYEGARGLRLAVDLDAVSSSLRLIVPAGFEVEDSFSDRTSSVVRNDPRGGEAVVNRVVLTGRLKSSVVKVKYRRGNSPRPRLGRA